LRRAPRLDDTRDSNPTSGVLDNLLRNRAAEHVATAGRPLRIRVWTGLARLRNWIQLGRFAAVGSAGYALNVTCFYLSVRILGAHFLIGAFAAFAVAVTNNFLWNRHWTFRASAGNGRQQAIRFLTVSGGGFAVAAMVLSFLVRGVHMGPVVAQAFSVAVCLPLTFMFNKLWTFDSGGTPSTTASARIIDVLPQTTRQSVCVVLPTYNEAGNLYSMVTAIINELADMSSDYVVLVVDDSSPDGTGDIADTLANESEHVAVIHRTGKRSLGRAYIAGFCWALMHGKEFVLQMDSDFSHDPRDIPRLLEAACGADLVLGSRYVQGGGVVHWGLIRRWLSRAGCWYAKKILGVPIRDLTGGFKCFRREALETLLSPEVRATGYCFQIEVTYRALLAGFIVQEVPIVFQERRAGVSKMSTRIVMEAAWQVPALRLGRPPPTGARTQCVPDAE